MQPNAEPSDTRYWGEKFPRLKVSPESLDSKKREKKKTNASKLYKLCKNTNKVHIQNTWYRKINTCWEKKRKKFSFISECLVILSLIETAGAMIQKTFHYQVWNMVLCCIVCSVLFKICWVNKVGQPTFSQKGFSIWLRPHVWSFKVLPLGPPLPLIRLGAKGLWLNNNILLLYRLPSHFKMITNKTTPTVMWLLLIKACRYMVESGPLYSCAVCSEVIMSKARSSSLLI